MGKKRLGRGGWGGVAVGPGLGSSMMRRSKVGLLKMGTDSLGPKHI